MRTGSLIAFIEKMRSQPWVLARLLKTLYTEKCAFVGAFPTGLFYRDDVRPQQQIIEFWDSSVRP